MSNPGPNVTSTSNKLVVEGQVPGDGQVFGAGTTDPISFHGASPSAQRAGSAQAAVATTGSTNSSPYGFTTSAQADALVALVNELRAALVAKGLIKGAS